MDLGTTSLLLVMSVLATNQVVMRLRALHERAAVFWALEALDVLFGGYVLWFGLPGLRHQPAIGLVVGLLVLLHAAQNLHVRQRHVQDMAEEARLARAEELRRQVR